MILPEGHRLIAGWGLDTVLLFNMAFNLLDMFAIRWFVSNHSFAFFLSLILMAHFGTFVSTISKSKFYSIFALQSSD